MDDGQKYLRVLIEKWLAPTPTMPARITRFKRTQFTRKWYVCVETSRSAGPLALFFFRHDDGTWRVFPAAPERPAMGASSARSAVEVSARPINNAELVYD